jgi:hypothetical protein
MIAYISSPLPTVRTLQRHKHDWRGTVELAHNRVFYRSAKHACQQTKTLTRIKISLTLLLWPCPSYLHGLGNFMGLSNPKKFLSYVWCYPYTIKESGQLHDPATLKPRKACPTTTDQNASWAPEMVWAERRRKKAYPSRELNPDSSLIHPAVQSVFWLTENY